MTSPKVALVENKYKPNPNPISIMTVTLISALLSCDYLIAEHCFEKSRMVEHTKSNKTNNMRDTHAYFILVTRSAGVQTEGETRVKDNLIMYRIQVKRHIKHNNLIQCNNIIIT